MAIETKSMTTKVSPDVADRVADYATRHRLTVSLAIRRFVEEGLANEVGTGPIEAATRAHLHDDVTSPQAATAVELARRLDVDPSNGAQHSRELQHLLDLLDKRREAASPQRHASMPELLESVLVLRRAGYGVRCKCGEPRGGVDVHVCDL